MSYLIGSSLAREGGQNKKPSLCPTPTHPLAGSQTSLRRQLSPIWASNKLQREPHTGPVSGHCQRTVASVVLVGKCTLQSRKHKSVLKVKEHKLFTYAAWGGWIRIFFPLLKASLEPTTNKSAIAGQSVSSKLQPIPFSLVPEDTQGTHLQGHPGGKQQCNLKCAAGSLAYSELRSQTRPHLCSFKRLPSPPLTHGMDRNPCSHGFSWLEGKGVNIPI